MPTSTHPHRTPQASRVDPPGRAPLQAPAPGTHAAGASSPALGAEPHGLALAPEFAVEAPMDTFDIDRPQMELFGLSFCDCPDAREPTRHALVEKILTAARTLPTSRQRPLVVCDVDAGGLWQLGSLVNGLLRIGHRSLVLHIADSFYPEAKTGEYRWSAAEGLCIHGRTDACREEAKRPLFVAEAPYTTRPGELARLAQLSAETLQRFLASVGTLIGLSQDRVSIDVNVYQTCASLAARIREGALPLSDIITGVDMNAAMPCEPTGANCLLLRDDSGVYGAMRHAGEAPTMLVLPGRRRSEEAAAAERRLRARLSTWQCQPRFVDAVQKEYPAAQSAWLDWPLLRLHDARATVGRADCLTFCLLKRLPDAHATNPAPLLRLGELAGKV